MADLTQSEKAVRYDKQEDKRRFGKKLQKIQLLRFTEAAAAGSTSFVVGAIKKWKPEVETALKGFAQPDVVTTVAGGSGYLLLKDGYGREAAGGVFMSGMNALMQKAGAWVYEKIAA